MRRGQEEPLGRSTWSTWRGDGWGEGGLAGKPKGGGNSKSDTSSQMNERRLCVGSLIDPGKSEEGGFSSRLWNERDVRKQRQLMESLQG